MKDLEKELERHIPKPRRPLRADFTHVVIESTRGPRHEGALQALRQLFHVRHISKAGALSLAAFVLVSGSVAAFALWPKPDIHPTITKKLPSGNRIVGYDAENCKYFSGLDGTPIKPRAEKIYYEVRKGSDMTDQKLKDSLRAVCEENISNNFVASIMKKLPQTKDTLSTLAYTVTGISTDSITVSPDPHYNARDLGLKQQTTYDIFTEDLVVYDHSSRAVYDDIAIGDTVKMVVHDHSNRSSETLHNYQALNHPEAVTIVAIVKIPPLSGDPGIFERAIATDIVRLEPCTESHTGFCRAYDFAR